MAFWGLVPGGESVAHFLLEGGELRGAPGATGSTEPPKKRATAPLPAAAIAPGGCTDDIQTNGPQALKKGR